MRDTNFLTSTGRAGGFPSTMKPLIPSDAGNPHQPIPSLSLESTPSDHRRPLQNPADLFFAEHTVEYAS